MDLTIEELARASGKTVRNLRALQSQGLLAGPTLVGRRGFYGREHLQRLAAIQRLQEEGFSLESIGVLLRAFDAGLTLAEVLGLRDSRSQAGGGGEGADEEDFFPAWPHLRRGQLLYVVPTSVLEPPAA